MSEEQEGVADGNNLKRNLNKSLDAFEGTQITLSTSKDDLGIVLLYTTPDDSILLIDFIHLSSDATSSGGLVSIFIKDSVGGATIWIPIILHLTTNNIFDSDIVNLSNPIILLPEHSIYLDNSTGNLHSDIAIKGREILI